MLQQNGNVRIPENNEMFDYILRPKQCCICNILLSQEQNRTHSLNPLRILFKKKTRDTLMVISQTIVMIKLIEYVIFSRS